MHHELYIMSDILFPCTGTSPMGFSSAVLEMRWQMAYASYASQFSLHPPRFEGNSPEASLKASLSVLKPPPLKDSEELTDS